MEDITKDDLLIILKAAIQMAQQDSIVVAEEKSLLKQIMEKGGIDQSEVDSFEAPLEDDVSELANHLSSEKAKKVLLLTLTATALADQDLDISEKELLENMTKKLKVGRIKLDAHTLQSCEKTVLKLISKVD